MLEILKKYGLMAFAIFASLWTILEPFNIYEVILPCTSKIILYLICVGISLFIPLCFFLFYKFQKPKIYFNRKKLEQNFLKLIQSSKKRIWVASIAGNSIISIDNFEAIITNSLNKNVSIKIVINEPNQPFIITRSKIESIGNDDRIKNRIINTITTWEKILSKLGSAQLRNISIKTHQIDLLPNAIYIFDDKIFVIPYLYKTLGENSILMEVDLMSNKKIFEKFENVFNDIWEDSQDIS